MTKRLLSIALPCLLSVVHAAQTPPPAPVVTAQSAIVIDELSGRVLWEKNANVVRFPASTTKILTALLLLEHTLPSDVITAPKDVDKVGQASLHLKPGEKVTAQDMLYALMLRSANDACYAVARHISGTQEAFAAKMNARAREIGATKTNFVNPHGLNDPKHVTTAHDLALIAREAMKHPEFREVARTRKHQITRTLNKADRWLISRNKWLAKDPSADGIKTGYTVPAGKCFVGSATRNGYRVITVVLKSEDWQADHGNLLRWAFANHEPFVFARRGDPIGEVKVHQGEIERVAVRASEDIRFLVPKGTDRSVTVKLENIEPTAPIVEGTVLGRATLTDATGFSQTVDVVAATSIATAPRLARAGSAGVWVLGAALLGATYFVRKRARAW